VDSTALARSYVDTQSSWGPDQKWLSLSNTLARYTYFFQTIQQAPPATLSHLEQTYSSRKLVSDAASTGRYTRAPRSPSALRDKLSSARPVSAASGLLPPPLLLLLLVLVGALLLALLSAA
jgi:hypothetical protein